MALPCPFCKTPINLTLDFIIQNPICACPSCKTIMDFTVNEDIVTMYREAMMEMEKIKKQHKGAIKFG